MLFASYWMVSPNDGPYGSDPHCIQTSFISQPATPDVFLPCVEDSTLSRTYEITRPQ